MRFEVTCNNLLYAHARIPVFRDQVVGRVQAFAHTHLGVGAKALQEEVVPDLRGPDLHGRSSLVQSLAKDAVGVVKPAALRALEWVRARTWCGGKTLMILESAPHQFP